MSKSEAGAYLRDAADKLDSFVRDLRDMFMVKGDDFVEPPDGSDHWLDVAARQSRNNLYGQLWRVLVPIHHALRVLGFRVKDEPLNETVIGNWTSAWEGHWDAPADVRELCRRMFVRGQRVMQEHSKLGIPTYIENHVGRHVIPCAVATWASQLAVSLREDAHLLNPLTGPAGGATLPEMPLKDVKNHEMTRPIPVAEAAKAAGERPDVLLRKLRHRDYPIGGSKGTFVAEFRHIQITLTKKKKQFSAWADENYPQS